MAEKKYFAAGRYIILKSDIDFYVRLFGKDNESAPIYLHAGTHEISNKDNEILNLIVSDESVKVGFSNQLFFLSASGKTAEKNLLVNGGFLVGQDGILFNSGTVPANNDDTYLHDQWILLSNGNNIVNVATIFLNLPPGASTGVQFTVQSTNAKFGYFQPIEQLNCSFAAGLPVSLSFQVKTTAGQVIDNMRAAIVYWTGTPDAITSDIVSAWNGSGVDPTLAANWIYAHTPVNVSLTPNWQKITINNIVMPSPLGNLGVFFWSDDTTTSVNDRLALCLVNLTQSSFASDYKYRSYEEELSLCERYFFKYDSADTNAPLIDFGQCLSATLSGILVNFRERMRVRPAMTYQTISNYVITDAIGTTLTVTTMVLWAFNSTDYNALIFAIVAAGLVPGNITYLSIAAAGAEALRFDSRL